MRNIFCLLFLFIPAALLGQQGGARITFAAVSHSFGQVAERGGKVSYNFAFSNTGDAPLIITEVDTSCGCVEVQYDKKPLPPGGQGVIKVIYNPRRQSGDFYKALQIHSTDPSARRMVIVVSGNVVKGGK